MKLMQVADALPGKIASRLKTIWQVAPVGTTARLRLLFLAPLAAVIVAIIGLLVYAFYAHMYEEIHHEVGRVQVALGKMYKNDLAHDVGMLRVAMEVFHHDSALREALARQDRARLLVLTAPVFTKLREQQGITHFYFSGPDRVNLLRVHQPERHGDVIARFTTLEAERTGAMAHGAELGPLGTFTLRLVSPWYADAERHRLLGYVELGMEIDHVLETVQAFAGVPVFVLVSKQYLRREDWEAGMRMLGRKPEWERFPDAVLSAQAAQAMPPAIAAALAGSPAPGAVLEAIHGPANYRLAPSLLHDAAGRIVGQMVAVIDVTHKVTEANRALWRVSAFVLTIGGMLFAFFYWHVGRVGRRIERDKEELQQFATRDGLTGLYNHRTFYALLEDELARAIRFDRPVSLLLLDIDHFKRVNDTHGHLAGDAVLKGLSELLGREARAIDRVCRYGGEEITVILPETDLEAAAHIAERLCAAVEAQPFDVDAGAPLRITVSIGVASWPAQADSAQTLVAAADTAMYAAKQGGRNRVVRYEPAPGQPRELDRENK